MNVCRNVCTCAYVGYSHLVTSDELYEMVATNLIDDIFTCKFMRFVDINKQSDDEH